MRKRLLIGALVSLGINVIMLTSLLGLAMQGDFDLLKIIAVDVIKIEVPKTPEPTPPPTPTPKPTPTPPPPEKTPETAPTPTLAPIAEDPTDTGPATVQTAPEIQDTPVPTPPPTPPPQSVVSSRELDSPPKIVKMVKPKYPPLAKRAGRQGVVRVRFLIDRHGRVTKVKVVFAKPKGLGFEDAAVAAVSQWVFEIPRLNGRPVAAWVVQTIRFQLE